MNFKKILKVAVTPAALTLLLVGCSDEGRTVATVDNEKIHEAELTDKLYKQYGSEMLDVMISNKIVELEADKLGIDVSKEEIEEEYAAYVEPYGGEDAFLDMIKDYNMKKEDVQDDIRLYLLTVKVLEDYVAISEEDVKAYFEENKEQFEVQEAVELSRIIVESEDAAKEAIAKLDAGEEFAAVAKEHSIEEGADQTGGSIGEIIRGELEESAESAAFSLAEGEYTKTPVKTEAGYEVLYVTKKTAAEKATYENSKEDARAALLEQSVNESYEPWLEEKREEYEITTKLFK